MGNTFSPHLWTLKEERWSRRALDQASSISHIRKKLSIGGGHTVSTEGTCASAQVGQVKCTEVAHTSTCLLKIPTWGRARIHQGNINSCGSCYTCPSLDKGGRLLRYPLKMSFPKQEWKLPLDSNQPSAFYVPFLSSYDMAYGLPKDLQFLQTSLPTAPSHHSHRTRPGPAQCYCYFQLCDMPQFPFSSQACFSFCRPFPATITP